MVGAVASTTVTVAAHELEARNWSVAVRETGVAPSAYGPAGVWATANGSPSGSNDPSFTEADAEQTDASARTVTFLQAAIGFTFSGTPLAAPRAISRCISLSASSGSIKRLLTKSSIAALTARKYFPCV